MFHRLLPYVILTVALSGASAAYADEPAAASVVDSFHETLTAVMQTSTEDGFDSRKKQLDPVINNHFDLSFISRVVIGRFWKSIDESERTEMIRTFTALTIATYASRFDGYSGETFKVVETRPLKKERVLVRSELHKSDGDRVQLDYVLHRRNEGWQIINVIANGVSDLSIKRADYAGVISEAGFTGLLARLNIQIEELSRS